MKKISAIVVFLLTISIISILSNETWADGDALTPSQAGSFSFLTYNVAGLPDIISGSHPARFNKLISPLLNDFDIVVVQEDFYYHDDLKSLANHPYIGAPDKDGTLGDGLGRFSNYPFSDPIHINWSKCYGTLGYANDCLTKKGYSHAVHTIASGVIIDVYNLHFDAGISKGDRDAREAGMTQLIRTIAEESKGKAVIVAGDFNMGDKSDRDLENYQRLLDEEGFFDSCRVLDCGEERIDKIVYRGSEKIELKAVDYKVEREKFRYRDGIQLSDHKAVSAVFEWKTID